MPVASPPDLSSGVRRAGRWLTVMLVAAGCLLGLSACVQWASERMAANILIEPGVALVSVGPGARGLPTRLEDLLLAEATLRVRVTVRNRNLIDVRILDVAWKASLNAREVAVGSVADLGPDGRLLPADAATEVVIEANIPLLKAGLAGIEAIQRGEARVEVYGTARAKALGITSERAFRMEIKDIRLDIAVPDLTGPVPPFELPPLGGGGLPGMPRQPGDVHQPGTARRDVERGIRAAEPRIRELGRGVLGGVVLPSPGPTRVWLGEPSGVRFPGHQPAPARPVKHSGSAAPTQPAKDASPTAPH
ncbi:MAG: hypothetical protein EXR79_16350 [Myxococcales bacterium]|nr:hypothetical protein [Myxococcales bacterium]